MENTNKNNESNKDDFQTCKTHKCCNDKDHTSEDKDKSEDKTPITTFRLGDETHPINSEDEV